MKTKIISLLAVTITAALISQPMFAVPITYVYTGNPFTTAVAPYSTNDFVTARVTLASPLGANMPFTFVRPLAFSLSDGVQTFTDQTPEALLNDSVFATGPTGMITGWRVQVLLGPPVDNIGITTLNLGGLGAADSGSNGAGLEFGFGFNRNNPGTWTTASAPDAGSSLALLSLSLTALGVAARQFKRAAA